VKYGQYDDALIALAEVDAVGETLGDSFAHVAVQHWELFRCAGDTLDQELDFSLKFHSESGAFLFIPIACVVKFKPRLPPEDDLMHYRRQRA